MKISLVNFGKKFKQRWRKEYILWGIVVIWTLLSWEGRYFLPGAKWLSDVIPLWLVILNLVFFLIFTTLLVNKKNLSPIISIVTLIGVLLSWILLSIGFKRFPFVSLIGGCAVILFNLGLKKWGFKGGRSGPPNSAQE